VRRRRERCGRRDRGGVATGRCTVAATDATLASQPQEIRMADWEPPPSTPPATIDVVVVPRTSDLTPSLKVQRALPSARRRMVGPFVFFDQFGPTVLTDGAALDVLPHPHIGLATVTYLFDGELLHRDSLGVVQTIRPGELNWMTAGRGIVHSERTPPDQRSGNRPLFGVQAWVALPAALEESTPAFAHHDAHELPLLEGEGKRVRLIAGSLFGATSPAQTLSALFYADAALDAGARLNVPATHDERAAYVLTGDISVAGGGTFGAGQLVVFGRGETITMTSERERARVLLLGGEPMDGHRHIWWNFVSSSRERIEQAKSDWQSGRFASVPGETEFIPLPERRPPPVQYP
jgi:redox-sensitive bicupin YhaK (pirin superfamily)